MAERWELYIGGLEIANAYSELTDPAEQRARFEECAASRKARGKDVYPIDEAFLASLKDMPPSGGIALGVDRLVMLLANAATIDEVMAFREDPQETSRGKASGKATTDMRNQTSCSRPRLSAGSALDHIDKPDVF